MMTYESRTTHGVWRTLLACTLLAGMLVVAPQAADADSVCNTGELCIWSFTNYGGDFWDPDSSDPSWPTNPFGSTDVANDDDSIKNRDTGYHKVYDLDSYVTPLYCVDVNEVEDDITGSVDNMGQSNLYFASATCPAGSQHP